MLETMLVISLAVVAIAGYHLGRYHELRRQLKPAAPPSYRGPQAVRREVSHG